MEPNKKDITIKPDYKVRLLSMYRVFAWYEHEWAKK